MKIAKINDADGYYIAENGYVYRRHLEDGKLHKIKGSWNRRGLTVSVKYNDGHRKVEIVSRLVAKYIMNETGNYSVYFINKDLHSCAPQNLRIKHRGRVNFKTDTTPKKVRINKGTLDVVKNSIYEAAEFIGIHDGKLRKALREKTTVDGFYVRIVL